jgi:superfamily II RNA helicase
MDTSYESDSDVEAPSTTELNLGISESEAKYNYEEAGKLIPEEEDPISLAKNSELIDSSCSAILDEVEQDLALPYNLSDFQKLSVNILLQKKDLILLSPTGSGKEC